MDHQTSSAITSTSVVSDGKTPCKAQTRPSSTKARCPQEPGSRNPKPRGSNPRSEWVSEQNLNVLSVLSVMGISLSSPGSYERDQLSSAQLEHMMNELVTD
ncbi:hypothetical protein Mp_2g23860 [Marchantia polymorpha subsp. ruderalis]|uniref:Uncharacterized protein n=1 Tax=Marchantia polymorpha TaxID=3197 RepID=A0A2R6WPB5_MARPO|nr:hypothetical protein MARPO_0069s0036 [Marchantia polymorpha]BBN03484.1 hypothetical protein Mp_2g23860 [Marchantia polymorpha subsp. ruderalis]|eukprot:PTQ35691.1 hypothetical protein MARPO_0069s0036 [Marchantia polymorpha]